MKVELVALDVGAPDFEKTIGDVPVRIGRHRHTDIRVRDPWVSRFHCEIEQIGGAVWVRDVGSKHGVFVNGFRVTSAQLKPGDRLTVGMTSYRINYERQTSTNAPPARFASLDGTREMRESVANALASRVT
jgi:pSer/pThr/pTyr-binding forkhead associated (FHA) protein